VTNDIELAGPRVYEGGAGEPARFLRLVTPPRPIVGVYSQNTITFPALADAAPLVVADFDLRIVPGPGLKRADGLGFALLNSTVYGTGAVDPELPCVSAEEPAFMQSIGVGFDVYQNEFDLGNPDIRINYSNSVSVHYVPANTTYAVCGDVVQASSQVEVSTIGAPPQTLPLAPDLASTKWLHARVLVEQPAASASAAVSVQLTPAYGETVTAANGVQVSAPMPFAPRAWFGARAGGEAAHFDLANIRVHSLNAEDAGIAFSKREVRADETGGFIDLSVTRVGNLNAPTKFQYATSNGTAKAGEDYQAVCREVSFQVGEAVKTVRIPVLDDLQDESGVVSVSGSSEPIPASDAESFTVVLSTSDPKTKILGPAEVTVRILDNESARVNGSWGPLLPAGIVAVHAALLPTGKILYLDRIGNVALWTPGGEAQSIVGPGYDSFCNGAAFLGDGRLLVCGGHDSMHGAAEKDGVGVDATSAFDPVTETWQRLPAMNKGRWYPTVLTQSDGSALVISGSVDKEFLKNALSQVYQPDSNTYRDLSAAENQPENADALGVDLYPRMVAIPNAISVKVGPDPVTWILDTKGAGAWTKGPITNWNADRIYGPIVLRGHRVMLVGGGGGEKAVPTNSVEELDLDKIFAGPEWRRLPAMNFRRRQNNATVLADGRVLSTEGCQGVGFSDIDSAVLPAEIYDDNGWRLLPAAAVPRCYHSIALLLPDGSVLTGGGGEGAALPSAQNNFQIYYPDYFYKSRPAVDDVPARVAYGSPFTIKTGSSVSRVTLVRLAAVTHAYDENQRFVELAPSPALGGVSVTVAGDGWTPPGDYILFVLDGDGVPSKGKVIRVASTL